MRNITKYLLLCTLFFHTCARMSAQESGHELMTVGDSLAVYFRQGVDAFDPSFRDNGARCREFVERLDELQLREDSRIAKVQIYASASPEGSVALNERLARNRAKSVTAYLHEALSFQDSIVFVQVITEDWAGLAALAAADPAVPSKDEAMAIILDGSDPDRKARLMHLDGGRPWDYLYRKYFPQLRSFRVYVYVTPLHPKLEAQIRTEVVGIPHKMEYPDLPVSLPVYEPAPQWSRELTLKTNLLGWALLGNSTSLY